MGFVLEAPAIDLVHAVDVVRSSEPPVRQLQIHRDDSYYGEIGVCDEE